MRERQRPKQYRVDNREDGGIRPDADREREDGGDCEAGPLPERARGVPQVLPEIADQSAAGGSRRDRRRRMRLPERRYALRQDIAFPEIGQRYLCGLVRGHTTCNQLPITVFEMLRELFDNLGLARGREAQAR